MLKIHLCAMVEAAVVRPSHALKLFSVAQRQQYQEA